MDFEADIQGGKSKTLVVVIVVVGIVVLGVGAYVAFTKRNGAGAGGSGGAVAGPAGEAQKWCKLRKEWFAKVSALDADIMLKSINPADAKDLEALVGKRNTICQGYAEKLEKLLKTGSKEMLAVETALVKEGKVRANFSVEIHNLVAKNVQLPAIKPVRKALKEAKEGIKKRMADKRRAFDTEVNAALAKVGGCSGIYRGPFTDAGTSASPYISWKELEMQRARAVKQLDERVKALEPMEQYGNQVYHELVRKYRKSLKSCYRKTKKRGVSPKLNLLVTLKGNGGVAKLGLVGAKKADEKALDCLLNDAANWKLPPPAKAGDRVSIEVDFPSL